MTDSTYIRAYNGKSIYTSGQMKAGSLRSDGDVSVAGVIQLDKINVAGATCPVNGALSRDDKGATLSCQSGVWTDAGLGKVGYYCRRTSFDKGRSDDYVGYTPRTDDNCPVIQHGQQPNGYCSCIKVLLAY